MAFLLLPHHHLLPNPNTISPAKISITRPTLILRSPSLSFSKPISNFTICATQKFIYPHPIPEFAKAETQKFRSEILKRLSKEKETFGDALVKVVDVCSQIFSEFLHKEYGGPGTLLVEPFTDVLVVLKEKKLPGAPLAARESLLWAQSNVDQDWQVWNSNPP